MLLFLPPAPIKSAVKQFVWLLVLVFFGSSSTCCNGVQGLVRERVYYRMATDTCASVVSSSSTSTMSYPPTTSTIFPYDLPQWVKQSPLESSRPKFGRLKLGNLPTPIHGLGSSERFQPYSSLSLLQELNITLDIKRDDMTGGPELGGNKVRKLEFLLADALGRGCNSIVTIGGEQSNHCRATACAARLVGLYPHLILRKSPTSRSSMPTHPVDSSSPRSSTKHIKNNVQDDDVSLGLQGNILFDRIVGSTIHTCTPGEYGRFGSDALIDMVCSSLRTRKEVPNNNCSSNPYPIPVGGSNALGTWGYIEGVNELMQQQQLVSGNSGTMDSIVVATGSGGTLAGIVLGLALYYHHSQQQQQMQHRRPVVHAVGVCDDPNYFYNKLEHIVEEMGYSTTLLNDIKEWVKIHQGKGRGYAQSTPEEMEFIQEFAQCTGIALDPVYTGKALYHFLHKVVKDEPETFRNTRVLFWHTGGSLGLQVRSTELMQSLKEVSPVYKLDVSTSRRTT